MNAIISQGRGVKKDYGDEEKETQGGSQVNILWEGTHELRPGKAREN